MQKCTWKKLLHLLKIDFFFQIFFSEASARFSLRVGNVKKRLINLLRGRFEPAVKKVFDSLFYHENLKNLKFLLETGTD